MINLNSKMKKQLSTLFLLTASFFSVSTIVSNPPSLASADWEYREGIFGEIKNIRICNQSWGTYGKIIAEAGSGDRGPVNTRGTVKNVQFKMYSGQVFKNHWYEYKNNPNWRPIAEKTGKRWFTYEFWYPLNYVNSEKPVKFAIHVNRTLPGISDTVYDLGGIKDLGKLPLNTCRVYNDGNIYDE